MAKKDREFLKAFEARHGTAAMSNRAPVAIAMSLVPDGPEFGTSEFYTTKSVYVHPVVDPVLVARFNNLDEHIHRTGARSWRCATGEDHPNTPFETLLNTVAPSALYSTRLLFSRESDKPLATAKDLTLSPHTRGIEELLGNAHGWAGIARRSIPRQPGPLTTVPTPAHQHGIVTVNVSEHSAFFSVFTHRLEIPVLTEEALAQLPLGSRPRPYPKATLGLWPHTSKQTKLPRPITPAEAIDVLEWAKSQGFYVHDLTGGRLDVIRDTVASSVIVWPAHAAPAQSMVSGGLSVTGSSSSTSFYRKLGVPVAGARVSTISTMNTDTLRRIMEAAGDEVTVRVSPDVLDVVNIASAKPFDGDARLKDYQQLAAGMHLATHSGYLNAIDAGMGKTICFLAAARERARIKAQSPDATPYRALVVAEANVRSQWCDEAATWFPEAHVVVLDSAKADAALRTALAVEGPVLVVSSYAIAGRVADIVAEEVEVILDEVEADAPAAPAAVVNTANVVPDSDGQLFTMEVVDGKLQFVPVAPAAPLVVAEVEGEVVEVVDAEEVAEEKTIGHLLLETFWDDIAADEAAALRNKSKQERALWILRKNADIAIALTGTPIVSGLDDIGRMIAWCRNDPDMFYGASLQDRFDVTTDQGLQGFLDAIGPLVFRRDSSEIQEDLPEPKADVVHIDLSPPELALAHAAYSELKKAHEDLVRWLEALEKTNPDAASQMQEVKEKLQQARRAWLGGTTLARQAVSDPMAIVDSDSSGAMLLASQGYIAAATAKPGSKRTKCMEIVRERLAQGKQVLIFTEFASVARLLIQDMLLQDIRVGGILGGGGAQRDRNVTAFQAQELDVLVATSAGKRGLNLQAASTIIHYDLPWTPDDVRQRIGRSIRLGSEHDEVEILFMVARNTVEEKIAALVVARSVQSMLALDVHRGRDMASTVMGKTVANLTQAVGEAVVDSRTLSLLEISKFLFSEPEAA